jgi:acetyl esterase/lipase
MTGPSSETHTEAAAEYLALAATWVEEWGAEDAAWSTEALLERFPELAAVSVQDASIDGPHGPVPIRLYDPPHPPTSTFMWIHGGAFATGDLDMPEANWVARSLAARGHAVVSVDYRKTVEGARYPVPSDDVRAAWRWLVARTAPAGRDVERLQLGGGSAGAALAAALVVRLRDAGERMPDSLVLAYPVVHPRLPAPSAELSAATADLPSTARIIEGMSDCFAGSDAALADPHAFAGLSDPIGFPPTLIINSERDHLRASGELFARQLSEAGATVECVTEAGSTHGHLNEPANPAGVRSLQRLADWLARTHRSTPIGAS